jgi:hypothetical protein
VIEEYGNVHSWGSQTSTAKLRVASQWTIH